MKIYKNIGIVLGAAWVSGMVLSACSQDKNHPGYEYMPNMYRSASYETYSENPNTANGTSAMKPAEGSIPRGYSPFEYGPSNEEYMRAGEELNNPLEITEKTLAEGKELYEIFCDHCHGAKGAGDGQIVDNGLFPPPPSYADGNSSRGGMMADLSEGEIYHTIVYGLNMMGAHASQINDEERWKIVAYVQTLQGKDVLGNAMSGPAEADSTQTNPVQNVEPVEANETEVQSNEESH